MLTLFTGVPGSGKTAAGVDLIRKLVADGRPLYVLEVPEENVERLQLKIPHTLLGDLESCLRWHEIVPDNAVVFCPEAQRIFPARPPSTKVPVHVEALGQHRHRGIDLVLDTQGEKGIDDKARSRVGRHVHLRDLGILGRHWYEWPECANTAQWKQAPVKMRYRLPKKVFSLYHSATTHTKNVRTIPPQIWILLLLIPLLIVLVFRIYGSISAKNAPAIETAPTPLGVMTGAPGQSYSQRPQAAPVTTADLIVGSTPRLSDDPRSEPRYDPLRVVVRMPRIHGGYCQGSRCVCYIDDALKAPISQEACARWIADPPFDAYHLPSHPSPQDRMQGGRREAGGSALPPGAGGAAPSEPQSGVTGAVL